MVRQHAGIPKLTASHISALVVPAIRAHGGSTAQHDPTGGKDGHVKSQETLPWESPPWYSTDNPKKSHQ